MNTDNGTCLSSGSNLKVDGVSDQFPVGLRVLVVDDDPTCLKILDKMLRNCLYEVTTCSRAMEALLLLRERKGGFDVVLSDVYMPDMDGFKLLELVGLEMDLPVIMMSADDGKNVVMKGITHGACDYLIKPVRMEAIKNIWQHVIRKKKNEWKDVEHSGSVEDSDKHKKPLDDGDYACSANEGSWKHSKRRKDVTDEEDEGEDRDDTSALKKPRVVWSVELHQQFVVAVNQLGIDKAVPKKILELMNVPGLTRENVASHLQKYRLYLRRLSGVQHQGGLNTSFVGGSESSYGSIASLDRFDFHALAVSGQLPQQNLATLQAGLGRINTNTGMGMSIVDPMNLFSSEVQGANSSSKIRYGPGQQSLVNNQVGLLQGLPTTLEPKQLAQMHHPIQSIGNLGVQVSDGTSSFLKLPPQLRTPVSSSPGEFVHQRSISHDNNSLMMQMTQQKQLPFSQHQNHVQMDMPPHQQRPQMLPSGMGQQMLSKEVSGRGAGRNGFGTHGRGTLALGSCMDNPPFGVVSQTSVDYSINHVPELPGNSFPMVATAGISSLTSTGMIREAMPATAGLEGLDDSSNLSGANGISPSYGLINDLRQSERQDWNLQNVNLSFDAAHHVNSIQRNADFSQSLLGNQGHKNGQMKGMRFIGKGMVSSREFDEQGNLDNIVRQHSNLLVNDSFRVKAESLPDIACEGVILPESFDQEDLMNALFKQQEGVGPVETEFNIDGFPMDNIHV